jgi:L-amino acid N-acyltransferase YncA
MNTHIRIATKDDAPVIQAIYAPIVENTFISFETEVPTVAEMGKRIETITQQYPWLVLEKNNEILGYVYASPHRSRMAYQWSVDVTAYIHQNARRMGVGRALFTSLFEILKLQGYYNAFAGIALPNAASVGLHEAMGFTYLGVYKNVGYKQNAWHDVGWWQLCLQETEAEPLSPKKLNQVPYNQVIQSGLSFFSG